MHCAVFILLLIFIIVIFFFGFVFKQMTVRLGRDGCNVVEYNTTITARSQNELVVKMIVAYHPDPAEYHHRLCCNILLHYNNILPVPVQHTKKVQCV